MQIDIINGRSYWKPLVEEAVEFFAYSLMRERVVKDLDITIEFTSYKDCAASCYVVEDDKQAVNPRKFYIEIANWMGTYNRIKTLGHEMVHVKQHAMNELHHLTDGGDALWKGKIVNSEKIKYWDQPWELEAYSTEEKLIHEFAEKNGHLKKPWYKKRYSV